MAPARARPPQWDQDEPGANSSGCADKTLKNSSVACPIRPRAGPKRGIYQAFVCSRHAISQGRGSKESGKFWKKHPTQAKTSGTPPISVLDSNRVAARNASPNDRLGIANRGIRSVMKRARRLPAPYHAKESIWRAKPVYHLASIAPDPHGRKRCPRRAAERASR